ncbi:MAG TPA: hypothetical protein VNJ47_12115 [Nevskiales bacterium]|nr:hypothetical protein [Nevskiales bacterium]
MIDRAEFMRRALVALNGCSFKEGSHAADLVQRVRGHYQAELAGRPRFTTPSQEAYFCKVLLQHRYEITDQQLLEFAEHNAKGY